MKDRRIVHPPYATVPVTDLEPVNAPRQCRPAAFVLRSKTSRHAAQRCFSDASRWSPMVSVFEMTSLMPTASASLRSC
jgi:hypothetical protein